MKANSAIAEIKIVKNSKIGSTPGFSHEDTKDQTG
jgi:hypothetical protein